MKKIGIQMKDKNNNEVYPNPFPVGAIYMSVDSRNPSTIFGGKWEQIKGRFLLGADDNYKVKETGGSSTHKHQTKNHTLSINEMPSHSHPLNKNVPYGTPYNDTSGVAAGSGGYVFYNESYSPFSIGSTGGNQGHNHGLTEETSSMPPYFVVYIWYRVS